MLEEYRNAKGNQSTLPIRLYCVVLERNMDRDYATMDRVLGHWAFTLSVII